MLLNPLPIYGLLMGIFGLWVALTVFRDSRTARTTALMLVCIGAISFGPVMHYGEAGYDRVRSMADREGGEWLEAHEYRAELIVPFYYALAALAVISILLPFKWPGSGIPSALVTLVLATGCAGAGAWVGYAGGKIRHTEFRNGPPPAIHSETDHDPD